MMHLTIHVYKYAPWVREGYDPTNGGISGRQDELEVFSEDSTDEEIRKWCEQHNKPMEDVARVNKRVLWGEKRYYIEPVVQPANCIGPMFGGNYATTNHSGWARMIDDSVGRPLPIHDRFETQREYDLLSM